VYVCLTGSGPGCPDLDAAGAADFSPSSSARSTLSSSSSSSSSLSSSSDVDVVYYYDTARGGELRANASCRHRGHVFIRPTSPHHHRQQHQQQQQHPGRDDDVWPWRSSISVYCFGFVWSEPVPTRCVG